MPRKAIVVLLSLISLLGLGLATPGAQAQLTQPYVSQATGITFPVEMEGLRLIRITDFEPRQRGPGSRFGPPAFDPHQQSRPVQPMAVPGFQGGHGEANRSRTRDARPLGQRLSARARPDGHGPPGIG